MSKPTEIKIAADIIRRVLDAAERGDIDYLNQVKQATRRKTSDQKVPDNKDFSPKSPDQNHIDPKQLQKKQENIEFGRYGSKFTEQNVLDEISRFENVEILTEFLKNKYATRFDIESVARAIHVPVTRNLDYDTVVSKIIDATLGYKIRSKAVRGLSSERKNKTDNDNP